MTICSSWAHVTVHIDEVANVVVVSRVAPKLQALGPQPQQQLCDQVSHWPRRRVWPSPQLPPVSPKAVSAPAKDHGPLVVDGSPVP